MGAADGHAKNFSLFLRPGGRFRLTPFYDVLSAQPAFDTRQISHRAFRLAMSAGATPRYKVLDVHGRHFVECGKAAGLGTAVMRRVLEEVRADAATATDRARSAMPADFHDEIHRSIESILPRRLGQLESALPEL